jgi:glycosyltransferase involved in cell wall biosynthesis
MQQTDSFTNLLTIAMPVFERKEFFREALESALNQKVKCKVIVVDNCSSHDYFEKVCKEKGVQYYRNDSNIGIAANFARGFELSDTKYVMNLQDDDLLSTYYVESFVNEVNKHPDIDVFFSDFSIITSKGEKSHFHTLPFGYSPNGNKIIEYGIKYKLGFPYMSSAIRKSKAHTVRDTIGWIGSYDWEWLYSVADKLSFFGDSRKLYHYRIHDNQITRKSHPSFILTLPFIYDKILKEKVSDPKLKKLASKNAFWELIQLKSEIGYVELKEIKNGNNKYDKYLNTKLKESTFLSVIFALPRGLVCFCFKVYKRLSFSK